MAIVRLLGRNISYSASPAMHMAAFADLGLAHTYELTDVEPEELPAAVTALRAADVLGANVTVPHKAAVLDLLDEIDPLASQAGAVNTIVNREGRLFGSNTDIPAIAEEIGRVRATPRNAVILGAGGASRAVEIALRSIGTTETTLVSRAEWDDLPRLIDAADVLINATPVGTNSDETPVDKRLLHPGLAVLDLVYRPSPTRLVHDAHTCGLEAHAGAGVLLGQGWRSLEHWLDLEIGDEAKRAMADALAAELGDGVDV